MFNFLAPSFWKQELILLESKYRIQSRFSSIPSFKLCLICHCLHYKFRMFIFLLYKSVKITHLWQWIHYFINNNVNWTIPVHCTLPLTLVILTTWVVKRTQNTGKYQPGFFSCLDSQQDTSSLSVHKYYLLLNVHQ